MMKTQWELDLEAENGDLRHQLEGAQAALLDRRLQMAEKCCLGIVDGEECGLPLDVLSNAYRCMGCLQWFCVSCAAVHFGLPERMELLDSELRRQLEAMQQAATDYKAEAEEAKRQLEVVRGGARKHD